MISKIRYEESSIKIDALSLTTFICGLLTAFNFNFIGEVYISEIILIPLGISVVVFSKNNLATSCRLFYLIIFFGFLSLLGYALSDIYIGTEPEQYLRGWGRIVLLLTNSLSLIVIVAKGRWYLWWFILGAGVGGLFLLLYLGEPISIWKLGYAEPISFIVIAISCILKRKFSIVILVSFGLVNLWLDYRNFAAIYIILSCYLIFSGGNIKSGKKISKNYFTVIISLLMALSMLIVGLNLTSNEYSARRDDSNVGRYVGILVSLRAIANSPIIGYGSWTINQEYAQMAIEEQTKRYDRTRNRKTNHNVNRFRSHSQILQPWVEGGLLGASFFIFYGFILIKGTKYYLLSNSNSGFQQMNLYFLILGLWHLIASPFGGQQRIQIAITIAILAAIEIQKRRVSILKNIKLTI